MHNEVQLRKLATMRGAIKFLLLQMKYQDQRGMCLESIQWNTPLHSYNSRAWSLFH